MSSGSSTSVGVGFQFAASGSGLIVTDEADDALAFEAAGRDGPPACGEPSCSGAVDEDVAAVASPGSIVIGAFVVPLAGSDSWAGLSSASRKSRRDIRAN